MDEKLTVKDVIGERMRWLTQRQRVVATNIANADTPGYYARELDESAFKALIASKVRPLLPVATAAGHISNNSLKGGKTREIEHAEGVVSPTENDVVLEEQMILSAENQMNYQTMVRLYRKQSDLMKLVLRR